jgi:hypothetical protein
MTELNYRPAASAVYYAPPRPFELARLVPMLLGALGAAVIGAMVYVAVLMRLNSLQWRVAAVLAFGAALGGACAAAVRVGRVYSPLVALLASCAVGLVALYASWLFWTLDVINRLGYQVTVVDLLLRPIALFEFPRVISEYGTWSYRGRVYRGPVLWVIWVVEALMIVLGATLIGTHAAKAQVPICRNCRARCRAVPGMPRLAAERMDDVRSSVEVKDFPSLLAHGPLRHEDDPQIDFELYSCPSPSCGQTHVLTVKHVAWQVNNEGAATVRTRVLVDRMLVTGEHVEQLKALRAQLDEAADHADDDADETAEDPPSPAA